MKNAALILNAVLLVAVAVLFYLHFSSKTPVKGISNAAGNNAANAASPDRTFKIGYFEWDSVTNHFALFKQMQDELNQKEEVNTREKMRLRQSYQTKINSYTQRELSQTESEAATQEIKSMEVDISNRMQRLDQELQETQMRKTNEIKTKIEDFLKEYNKEKAYSYILAYEPTIIFFRDTMYNITSDLIRGLNEKYPGKKKK